jgi:septum formation protein
VVLENFTTMKLILASASPRRAEILRDAGINFEIRTSRIDESRPPGEPAHAIVARLAESKARAAVPLLDADMRSCIVLGADTVVELGGEIFGKPRNEEHAREMLTKLSGRTHHVLTSIFLLRLPDGATRAAVENTAVTFAPLHPEEIDTYVGTGEPLDKAGAYAVQGIAGRYILRIDGCYFNVVGLPLAKLYGFLRELDWRPGTTEK